MPSAPAGRPSSTLRETSPGNARLRRMVRLVPALTLALSSSGCTVLTDVDYRHADGTEAGDFIFDGTVNFYSESYADPGARYAAELDVETGVDLPLMIQFATDDEEWTADLQGGLCENGWILDG